MRAAAGLACVLSGARFLCRPVRKNNHLQCACSIWVWLLSYDWFILILFFIIIDHRLGRDGRNWYKDSVYPTSSGTHPYDVITLGGVRGPSSRLKKKNDSLRPVRTLRALVVKEEYGQPCLLSRVAGSLLHVKKKNRCWVFEGVGGMGIYKKELLKRRLISNLIDTRGLLLCVCVKMVRLSGSTAQWFFNLSISDDGPRI